MKFSNATSALIATRALFNEKVVSNQTTLPSEPFVLKLNHTDFDVGPLNQIQYNASSDVGSIFGLNHDNVLTLNKNETNHSQPLWFQISGNGDLFPTNGNGQLSSNPIGFKLFDAPVKFLNLFTIEHGKLTFNGSASLQISFDSVLNEANNPIIRLPGLSDSSSGIAVTLETLKRDGNLLANFNPIKNSTKRLDKLANQTDIPSFGNETQKNTTKHNSDSRQRKAVSQINDGQLQLGITSTIAKSSGVATTSAPLSIAEGTALVKMVPSSLILVLISLLL